MSLAAPQQASPVVGIFRHHSAVISYDHSAVGRNRDGDERRPAHDQGPRRGGGGGSAHHIIKLMASNNQVFRLPIYKYQQVIQSTGIFFSVASVEYLLAVFLHYGFHVP